ncbi:MAG: ATP-binding cassette domain-containing protein [Deltaproteobacteria bacterium]|jgi:phospholipid/cholesterol/gamma-HCH transport system ATP-binding protein|nr:ATP-binding cassette domain-containing protein [Deltaproteobacteria bacterium]
MSPEPIIKVRNLVAQYGNDVILQDLSFDVAAGEILVIVGSSGSGKSTLLKHLIGLQRPHAGEITINGVNVTGDDPEASHRFFRDIGVLFQGSALFGSMTLAENIALPIVEYGNLPKDAVRRLVSMKLCQFDLIDYQDHMPGEVSGGMKKRAGLARALALNPKILFLDEPTAGLDPVRSMEIDELIRQINAMIGTTMVIVTHELDSIFNIAKRVIMIDKGKKGIIAEGNPLFLKKHSPDPLVKQFFRRRLTPESEDARPQ